MLPVCRSGVTGTSSKPLSRGEQALADFRKVMDEEIAAVRQRAKAEAWEDIERDPPALIGALIAIEALAMYSHKESSEKYFAEIQRLAAEAIQTARNHA